jgi:hypothetical protein
VVEAEVAQAVQEVLEIMAAEALEEWLIIQISLVTIFLTLEEDEELDTTMDLAVSSILQHFLDTDLVEGLEDTAIIQAEAAIHHIEQIKELLL